METSQTLTGIRVRKYSYRQQDKRDYSRSVLYYITHPDEKPEYNPKYGKVPIYKKRYQSAMSAYNLAHSFKKPDDPGVSRLKPVVNEIRAALKQINKQQLTILI